MGKAICVIAPFGRCVGARAEDTRNRSTRESQSEWSTAVLTCLQGIAVRTNATVPGCQRGGARVNARTIATHMSKREIANGTISSLGVKVKSISGCGNGRPRCLSRASSRASAIMRLEEITWRLSVGPVVVAHGSGVEPRAPPMDERDATTADGRRASEPLRLGSLHIARAGSDLTGRPVTRSYSTHAATAGWTRVPGAGQRERWPRPSRSPSGGHGSFRDPPLR